MIDEANDGDDDRNLDAKTTMATEMLEEDAINAMSMVTIRTAVGATVMMTMTMPMIPIIEANDEGITRGTIVGVAVDEIVLPMRAAVVAALAAAAAVMMLILDGHGGIGIDIRTVTVTLRNGVGHDPKVVVIGGNVETLVTVIPTARNVLVPTNHPLAIHLNMGAVASPKIPSIRTVPVTTTLPGARSDPILEANRQWTPEGMTVVGMTYLWS